MKESLIKKIRIEAVKLFNKDVVNLHYNNNRLMRHNVANLYKLIKRLKKQIDNV
jgi:hypothetical protein